MLRLLASDQILCRNGNAATGCPLGLHFGMFTCEPWHCIIRLFLNEFTDMDVSIKMGNCLFAKKAPQVQTHMAFVEDMAREAQILTD